MKEIRIKPLPYLRFFLIVFLAINLVGIINFPLYKTELKNNELFLLIAIGFSGFLLGSFLIRTINFRIKPAKGRFKPKLFDFIFYITNIGSLLLIGLTHILNKGIILFMGDARFKSFAYTNLFIYLAIITSLIYFAQTLLANKKMSWKFFLFIGIQCISVLSMGYRSPLIILAGGCALIFIMIRNDHQNKYKNVFTVQKVFAVLALLVLMSSISAYRVSQQYEVKKFFRNIDFEYLDDHPYLKPFMPTLAVFRYDQQVVKKLIKKTKHAPLKGELAISNFITVLPGEQLGARNIIGKLVGARKLPDGRPWSITPTIQGALFVDGGFIAVFVGLFLLGAFIEYTKKLMVGRKDPFSIVLYALFTINSLMIIHTGYFDVLLFILVFGLFFLKFILMRINFTHQVTQD